MRGPRAHLVPAVEEVEGREEHWHDEAKGRVEDEGDEPHQEDAKEEEVRHPAQRLRNGLRGLLLQIRRLAMRLRRRDRDRLHAGSHGPRRRVRRSVGHNICAARERAGERASLRATADAPSRVISSLSARRCSGSSPSGSTCSSPLSLGLRGASSALQSARERLAESRRRAPRRQDARVTHIRQ